MKVIQTDLFPNEKKIKKYSGLTTWNIHTIKVLKNKYKKIENARNRYIEKRTNNYKLK